MKNHMTTLMAALMLTGSLAAAQPQPMAAVSELSSALDVCQKIALARVPGEVLERRAQRYPTGVNYEFLIATDDGRKVLVAVDGKTRKVFAIMEELDEIPTGMMSSEE